MRRRITLVEWCAIAGRGVWPYTPTAGGEGAKGELLSLVKFLEFLLDRDGFQREKSVFDHELLPFFTIDKFDEFSDDRIQWFIGRLVDIEIEMTPKRIRSIVRVLLAGLLKWHAVFLREWNGADIRCEVPNATVTDAGLIFAHALDHGG